MNLALSLRPRAARRRDPFDGATLEWATTSPPPAYNFAVIPTVTSPYPMWDARDREEDVRRLERGEMVLDRGPPDAGHARSSTPSWDEVLDMPSDSPWPILLAAALALVFVFLLTGHWTTALVFAGAVRCGARRLALAAEAAARRASPRRGAGARCPTAGGAWRSSSPPRRRCSAR